MPVVYPFVPIYTDFLVQVPRIHRPLYIVHRNGCPVHFDQEPKHDERPFLGLNRTPDQNSNSWIILGDFRNRNHNDHRLSFPVFKVQNHKVLLLVYLVLRRLNNVHIVCSVKHIYQNPKPRRLIYPVVIIRPLKVLQLSFPDITWIDKDF